MIRFSNTYDKLPSAFFEKVAPTPVRAPQWIRFNDSLAHDLGLDVEKLKTDSGLQIFSGNQFPKGASSIAMAYAGHQFGHFVPSLGDGRAILMGEVIDIHGQRRDLHLKGTGPTKFSRRGDGRAALGPVLREFIISEAMHALGVPATRTLAAVTTGEVVQREEPQMGAVLTRVAASHLRVGTFEYFAARRDLTNLKILADYAIERHFPGVQKSESPYADFLGAVACAQAKLISQWMLVGFIHGVMNTDNMTISGESIDFGPCAFMDEYNPDTVFSSIDRQGRYAYNAQSTIGQWNIACLAQSLLPLFSDDENKAIRLAEEKISLYADHFEENWRKGFCQKIGIQQMVEDDKNLIVDLLKEMFEKKLDYTNTFLALELYFKNNTGGFQPRILNSKLATDLLGSSQNASNTFLSDEWILRCRKRLSREPGGESAALALMQKVNPVYIPRNHQVAKAIGAAEKNNDYSSMSKLMDVLSVPFVWRQGWDEYLLGPKPEERVTKTFCGT